MVVFSSYLVYGLIRPLVSQAWRKEIEVEAEVEAEVETEAEAEGDEAKK